MKPLDWMVFIINESLDFIIFLSNLEFQIQIYKNLQFDVAPDIYYSNKTKHSNNNRDINDLLKLLRKQ